MANRYWVGTGNWNTSNTANWSTSSGGTTGASVPTSSDNVFFDANSGGGTCNPVFGNNLPCLNLDFTGFTGIIAGNGGDVNVYGNLTFSATMTDLSYRFTMYGTGKILTTNGLSLTGNSSEFMTVASGASVTLGDNLRCTYLNVTGTLNTGNFSISATRINAASGSVINFGSSYITIRTGEVGFWIINAAATINAGTSTIEVQRSSTQTGTFDGQGKTYNNIYFPSPGTGIITISGSNTFNDFKINGSKTIAFTAGTTQIITSLTASGTSGNLVTLQSTSSGSAWNISKSSGTVSLDYLSLQDSTATGGATWYAGANSTNVSGNTGWIFTAPPPPPGQISNISSITNITSITI